MERLVMISTPYQMLLMKIRQIYRWDNRTETAMYLAAYTFLWAADYLAGACVSRGMAGEWYLCLTLLDPSTNRDGAQTPLFPTYA